MNKTIVCTLLFATASLIAEDPVSLNEQVENKQETVAPKVESPPPARSKKAPKTKALNVQAPTPKVKEEVVAVENPALEQETLVVEALKEPTAQVEQVDPLTKKIEALETRLQELEAAKVSVQVVAPLAMEEPAKEEASALRIRDSALESTAVTSQLSSTEETPVLQVEATEPAMVEPEPTTMKESETKTTSMGTKKEEKLGKSRFANIAIGTASAAVVIVAAILGSN